MGEVYLARHEGPAGFERTVVVKRVLRRFADDQRLSEMIVNEARVAALVIHPNAVQVYELGHAQGEYFIAMEYVHGRSLHQALDRLAPSQRVAPALAAQICWQLLQGLHAVHRCQDSRGREMGIVHRDVSPDNVLVTFEGVVKVTDFGIMKSGVLSNARDGVVQGKLTYVSPEQSLGLPVDPRADVYATGILLYEMLTGSPPFVAPARQALLLAIQQQPPPPLGRSRPDIPAVLETIVMRALEKKPEARFSTAREMALELERYLVSASESLAPAPVASWMQTLFPGEAALAPGLGTPGPPLGTAPLSGLGFQAPTEVTATSPIQRRSRRWPALSAAALLLLALAGGWWVRRRVPAAQTPATMQVAAMGVVPLAPPVLPTPVAVAVPPPLENSAPTNPVRLTKTAPRAVARAGHLSVRVNPWANVSLNGKPLGVSPVGPISVPAGRATVVLRNPELGLERRLVVRISPNQEVLLKEDLYEKPRGR
jgi:serine/threonine-protein kinase